MTVNCAFLHLCLYVSFSIVRWYRIKFVYFKNKMNFSVHHVQHVLHASGACEVVHHLLSADRRPPPGPRRGTHYGRAGVCQQTLSKCKLIWSLSFSFFWFSTFVSISCSESLGVFWFSRFDSISCFESLVLFILWQDRGHLIKFQWIKNIYKRPHDRKDHL